MIIVVTGLAFEARIAAGDGVRVICQQNATLADVLVPAIAEGCEGVVSFGTAGGLDARLRPGDWVVARDVIAGPRRFEADARWSAALRAALSGATPEATRDARQGAAQGAMYGDIAGVPEPVVTASDKAALHRATHAIAADMESQVVARLATAREIPFVCCRVVIDPAERSLPDAALAGMRPDGSTDVGAVIRSLLRRPMQLGALLRVARDAAHAQKALARGRKAVGARFGFDAR
ncbi:phosphorylase [Pararobbsia silviterrae]|uniref:Phosphorylase n=1 Tax=Pararobbsia silviterrae TaxID=1792498 RepID=A0A494XDM1_9BURK|nr:phosphorylase [Pararobbsia silviterrae]RKP46566.1 phosphorylase [Pararobbsia silviterrae]